MADSAVRGFRIVLNEPGETFDIQQECGVFIGDKHPVNDNLYCVSFDGRLDGESRMVYSVSFQYQSTADAASSSGGGGGGADPKSQPPDVRPANWSVSSSLIEVPVYSWQRLTWFGREEGFRGAPRNAAGDRFDAITKYEPLVTISVQHWETKDPTTNVGIVGSINVADFAIGGLNCRFHSLMLRGISAQPAIESWGGRIYKGWNATYEFAYRKNEVDGLYGVFEGEPNPRGVKSDIGWDIAVPETGFNCIAFNPNDVGDRDIFGQILKHEDGKVVNNPYQLPGQVRAGDLVRAMVRVPDLENGGDRQSPSAQPIALNPDGTPRRSFGLFPADPPVVIRRYMIYPEYNFNDFNLRGIGG